MVQTSCNATSLKSSNCVKSLLLQHHRQGGCGIQCYTSHFCSLGCSISSRERAKAHPCNHPTASHASCISFILSPQTVGPSMLRFLSLLQPWFKANVCANCFHPTVFKACEHSRRGGAIWSKDPATLKPEHLQHLQQGKPRTWAASQVPEGAAELGA